MFGSFFSDEWFGVGGSGLFYDWKMSGPHYSDYADYRVGSPITMHYHKWSTSDSDWYGPILRIGGSHEQLHECGQFACMYSRLETSLSVFGSVIPFSTLTTR